MHAYYSHEYHYDNCIHMYNYIICSIVNIIMIRSVSLGPKFQKDWLS